MPLLCRVSNKMYFFLLATIVILPMIFVSSVAAQGTPTLSVGSRSNPSGGSGLFAVPSSGMFFYIYLDADRSYACTAIPQDSDTELQFAGTVNDFMGNILLNGQLIGDMSPGVSGRRSTTLNHNTDTLRVSFTTQTEGTHAVNVSQAASSGESVQFECLETTLYGGYNTNVNDFNFLELTNISNKTITGTVTAKNWDGTTVIDAQAFSVGAGLRVDIDIHSAAGNNKFGSLTVTHSGPFGALQGAVSQYQGTVSNFSLVASVALRPRTQAY